MQQEITQQMRGHVTAALEEHLRLKKSGHDPVVLPDELIRLMHSAADTDPEATIDNVIDETAFLIKEYCDRATIREYLVLRQHFNPADNMMVRIMLLLGLHHPERNREPMDHDDQVSIQRNVALLKAITLLRKHRYGKLLNKALAYNDQNIHQMEQGFRDNHCADLIIDHPEHHELLMDTMLERGYEEGIEVFRGMIAGNAHSLSGGVL